MICLCRACGKEFKAAFNQPRRKCDECKRARQRIQCREWRARNPDSYKKSIIKAKKKQQEWAKANPKAKSIMYRVRRLKQRYGITIEQFNSIASSQQGKCAICGTVLATLPPRHTHVDHDHQTGRIRGILCHPCNIGLGNFKETIASFKAAITYLRKHA